jgi:[acyl-carrier-protein] S-malonyltransferase
MGKSLCREYDLANTIFDEANAVLGFDLKNLCFEGPIEKLTQTENAQPAILTASYAAFRVYQELFDLSPAYMAGHSLGEYTALTAAGALRFGDAVKIVRKRGEFMRDSRGGIMAAVKNLPAATIEEVCQALSRPDAVVVPANYNEPMQTVISGDEAGVRNVAQQLETLGGEIVYLKVSAAFHSPLMRPAAEKLHQELLGYSLNDLSIPVIANVDARPYPSKQEIVTKLTKQMDSSVRWSESLKFLEAQGVTLTVDTGPGSVTRNLTKKNSESISSFTLDQEEERKNLALKLGAKNFQFIKKSLGIAVSEPNRNWDNDEYDRGVVAPYRKIKEIYLAVYENTLFPKKEYVRQAMAMLVSVFETKKVPLESRKQRLEQIVAETGLEELFPEYQERT